MIQIIKHDKYLIFNYSPDFNEEGIYNTIMKDEKLTLRKTFTFSKKNVMNIKHFLKNVDEEDYTEPINFKLGQLIGDYYKIDKNILSIKNNLYINKNIKLLPKHFTTVKDISIFSVMDKLVTGKIYIGGNQEGSIPEDIFLKLVQDFPNYYELQKYVSARVSVVLKNYVELFRDYERSYNDYLNKKISLKGVNLLAEFRNIETNKFAFILRKLKKMLRNENQYNEKQWQLEILQILMLLYPKYIKVFTEVRINDSYNVRIIRLDYMLIDSEGNVDVIEIKKPFENAIMTKNMYRNNYIPMRDLSGTVMQIEKYIFHLSKSGKRGEDTLTRKYKDELPENFKILITNPKGLIIMGRDNNLTKTQKSDFEIVKRKYKSVLDILTYDDLIRRLEFTIKQYKSANIIN